MDLITLGMSKKYTEDTTIGLGAIKGAPATIEKITPVEGGNNVTFLWTGTDGTQQRQTLFVANGQKGEAGPQGPRGEKGEKGEPGSGSSATIGVSWDGNIEGLEGVDFSVLVGGEPGSSVAYKISDLSFTKEQLEKAQVECTDYTHLITLTDTEPDVREMFGMLTLTYATSRSDTEDHCVGILIIITQESLKDLISAGVRDLSTGVYTYIARAGYRHRFTLKVPLEGTIEVPYRPSISGGSAIIDVVELPTENINEQALYRVLKAQFVFNGTVIYDYQCYCVASLPEVGEVVTDASISFLIGYYNMTDNEVYGYVDEALGSGLGVPAGWYPFSMLASAGGVLWGEVITDIEDIALGDTLYLLLSYDYYTYKDEWTKMVFASEKSPKFDIKWDGVIGDRVALDMSQFGHASGLYFVKVSDDISSLDNIVGGSYFVIDSDAGSGLHMISEYSIDSEQIPGADVIDSYIIIVYDSDALSAALGIPAGIYTNGVYFWYYEGVGYVKNFTSVPRITPIEIRYLPKTVRDIAEAWEVDYYPTLHDVETAIQTAIGNAIGGSY